MTAPLAHRATGQIGVAVAGETSPQLDYSKVRAYWKRVRTSMLGPYMMDGYGFPAGAGRFRFRGELNSVAETIRDLRSGTSVLDLGSGVGVWTEYFAQRFAKVVAVEASSTLYEVLKDRCSRYPNVTAYNRGVLSFEPKGEFGATDGFGFPAGAGRFRFRGELNAVADAIQGLGPGTSVLDLGSGGGVWTEYFAQRFAKVVAVEGSSTLYKAL